MILLLSLACLLSVVGVTLGLGWPLAARLRLGPAERLLASAALGLIAVYAIGWTVYVTRAPVTLLSWLPAASVLSLALHRRALWETLRAPEVRPLVVAQGLVTVWCVGWLALVVSYSGGGWAGDWFEHWERMRFFLERWPLEHRFIGLYALPARPPLVNVVTGVFLAPLDTGLPWFQLVTTLLSSLAFLPVALLARRFNRATDFTPWLVALACMLSPLFVQNATFAWTKLPAAFFVLAALHFFLRARDETDPALPLALAGLFLAAGLLAHYSAGPYVVMLALLWLASARAPRRTVSFWRVTALAAVAPTLLLLTWFAWTATTFDAGAALTSTTTAQGADANPRVLLQTTLLNIRDTFVPHFLRRVDGWLIAQESPWGAARDFFFQAYQLNLLFAFGSVGWLALLLLGWRRGRMASPRDARFWTIFVVGTVVLGIASHAPRDTWGLAHICLQPLVLLGLALLAAAWPSLSRPWRLGLLAGAIFDLACGIVLHFSVQGFLVDRWFGGADWVHAARTHYNVIANRSLAGKLQQRLSFFSDLLPVQAELVLALLLALLMLAVVRARRSPAPSA